jgi:hypothetical protein
MNMSFGFSNHPTKELRAAVTEAYAQGIKLFAAAGNDGRNTSSVAFPATAPGVFAVFASNGRGASSNSINPPSDLPRWSTLGHSIPFQTAGRTIYSSGTSYATPLMVGMIASTLHFLRHYRSRTTTGQEEKDILEKLEEYNGVGVILRTMSDGGSDRYVAPWKLWKQGCSEEEVVKVLMQKLRP